MKKRELREEINKQKREIMEKFEKISKNQGITVIINGFINFLA